MKTSMEDTMEDTQKMHEKVRGRKRKVHVIGDAAIDADQDQQAPQM